MDPITGYLIIAMLIWGLRGAWEHARADYRRTRDADLSAAAKKSGKPVTTSVRRKVIAHHRTGWWASEVSHGFPVARTGMHAGWLAHRAAAMQTRAQREAQRTASLDARASYARAVKDHRPRQAAILAEIEEALATSGVTQDGSKLAVVAAAEGKAIVLPYRKPRCQKCRRNRAVVRAARHLPGRDEPGEPMWLCGDCAAEPCTDQACADTAPASRPLAESADEANARLSAHLRPGDGPCEACRGSGGNADLTDACAVCRGWGRADADPATMPTAPEGTVCTACGRRATPEDPVVTDRDGSGTHRSHAAEAYERYQAALSRDQSPATEGAPAMTGADYNDDYEHPSLRDATRVTEYDYIETEGAPSVSDTNYHSVLTACNAAVAQSDQDTSTIRGRKDAAYRLADEMIAANVDPAVVSAQMSYADSLGEAEKHLAAAGEHAASTSSTAQRYHGLVQEAVDASPGRLANKEFHQGS